MLCRISRLPISGLSEFEFLLGLFYDHVWTMVCFTPRYEVIWYDGVHCIFYTIYGCDIFTISVNTLLIPSEYKRADYMNAGSLFDC